MYYTAHLVRVKRRAALVRDCGVPKRLIRLSAAVEALDGFGV
jgi:hypothetical protein